MKLTHVVILSANEITTNAGKKTVSAEDVFKALDDIEFGFLREPLEQEFASEFILLFFPCHHRRWP